MPAKKKSEPIAQNILWYYTAESEDSGNHGGFASREEAVKKGIAAKAWAEAGEPKGREAYFQVFGATDKLVTISEQFDVRSWWQYVANGSLAGEFWEDEEGTDSLETYARKDLVDSLDARIKDLFDAWQREFRIAIRTGFLEDRTPVFRVQVVRVGAVWQLEDIVEL